MLCFNLPVHADSLEVIGGSLTYHLIDNGGNIHNRNRVSENGRLIDNPVLGISVTNNPVLGSHVFQSFAAFVGENSEGLGMAGGLYETGWELGNFQLGGIVGAYVQDNRAFYKAGEKPFSIAETGIYGIVPLVGAAINYKVSITKAFYLKLSNIITPVIASSTLNLGFNF